MLRYAITSPALYPPDELQHQATLLRQPATLLSAPVFKKLARRQNTPLAQGLGRLRAAAPPPSPTPAYAPGGAPLKNAPACLDAGAAGVAGIRLFHQS